MSDAAAVLEAVAWVATGYVLSSTLARMAFSRPALPPYKPPEMVAELWRVGAALHIYPDPALPCGCPASWQDVSIVSDRDPDGTVYSTIGAFSNADREYNQVRTVAEEGGGLKIREVGEQTHSCRICGGRWVEPAERPDSLRPGRPVEPVAVPKPTPSEKMRALPADWTRLDRVLNEEAGQVSEYVRDDTWEAFIEVFDASDPNNEYQPELGPVCAVLLTGDPDSGVWERDTEYGDSRTEAAKRLMRRYNDGAYGTQ